MVGKIVQIASESDTVFENQQNVSSEMRKI